MPQLVQSIPGYELELTSAYIGGCSLERHRNNLAASDEDPEAKQYQVKVWKTHDTEEIETSQSKASINELISQDSWDVITLQQASHFSWDYGTYEQWADPIVEYIHAKAPSAKIWIQQTWAYRADDGRIMPGGAWGFDQAGMHERVTNAYEQFSKHLGAPLIPTGAAVALFRSRVEKPFVPLTDEEKAALVPPTIPDQSGDVVGNNWWAKDKDNPEKMEFKGDKIHLNSQGHYLQACVWFLRLYGVESLPEGVYQPKGMTDERAKLIRSCAEDAVRAIVEKEKAETK